MVPIAPHASAATENAVHRPRHADREPLTSAHEPGLVLGLDDEMDVVGLHTEMQDPERSAGGGSERSPYCTEDTRAA